ncbi:MAG: glycine cleavage system aminomethyltransferase GcvT [Acidimicrobiales bacterium]
MSTPSPSPALRSTPLLALHEELGGRIVDFAGWQLPIQYEGVIAEHTACRTSAVLFDVSHMATVSLRGAPVEQLAGAMETVTPGGITTLAPGAMRYCVLTTDDGGVIDDLMVTNNGDHLGLVLNASRRDVDLAHLRERLGGTGGGIEVIEHTDVALLALQGPKAVDALARIAPGVADLFFMEAARFDVDGVEIAVSRSGYTGEDGVEITVGADDAEAFARRLLDQPEVSPAGLGARDTLRLEAGLCLYGNDLDLTTSPVEANLRWTIPKRRRDAADFPGADRILTEWEAGPSRVRVGLAPVGKRPLRDGTELVDPVTGEQVGVITSGGFGPTVDRPVAMGYVAPELAAVDTPLVAKSRGKSYDVTVADLPFSPHTYVRRPR